ncbi:DUF2911 domain-containing protein [Flagellimonas sp. CMM7]|uniref:DUF2911 domain-containing protein n=1 Tax=Flagellimonas sp. CMM7 TaxID=2654676 RepID=UPI0013D2DB97|nr:DUF2911 domain-containing protein [Flagellimonas sp. CMM7]UII79854.1 DUF2911 domain-containing protein [Flagellimonas sp. CMM7]
MNKFILTIIAISISFYTIAQSEHFGIDMPIPSPKSKVTQTVGFTNVTIEYFRPSIRGRKIFGGLVPYNEIWRTGANEASKFTFSKDITLGGVKLVEGSYIIITTPNASKWQIHIHQFDEETYDYSELQPLATFNIVPKKLSEPIESFLIDLNNLRRASCTIDISWENTLISIPLEVDTEEVLMSKIMNYQNDKNDRMFEDYFSASAYLLERGIELEKALNFANKALEINTDAFWVLGVKANILAKLGNHDAAISIAEESIKGAHPEDDAAFAKSMQKLISSLKN